MPENINFKVTAGHDNMKHRSNLTMPQAVELIKGKKYPAELEAELIKNLQRQPSNTYEKFLKSIGKQIAKIQKGKNDGKDKT
jgi:hypothetical protein